MDKKERRIRALLSFLMPGLGSIYAGNYKRGMFLFVCFAALLAFPVLRVFVPLMAFLAAWDAYRLLPNSKETVENQKQDPTWRRFVFFSAGFFGFFGWFILVGSDSLPFGAQSRVQSRVDPLVQEIKSYKIKHGAYPESLVEMLTDRPVSDGAGEAVQADPWGTPFEYRRIEEGFEIHSAGKDHVFGTGDDFIYRFR